MIHKFKDLLVFVIKKKKAETVVQNVVKKEVLKVLNYNDINVSDKYKNVRSCLIRVNPIKEKKIGLTLVGNKNIDGFTVPEWNMLSYENLRKIT